MTACLIKDHISQFSVFSIIGGLGFIGYGYRFMYVYIQPNLAAVCTWPM